MPQAVNPEDIIEWCAKELEWMSRGHVAHESDLLHRAAKRLREESPKILLRAQGKTT
jgi:hypothetical protein